MFDEHNKTLKRLKWYKSKWREKAINNRDYDRIMKWYHFPTSKSYLVQASQNVCMWVLQILRNCVRVN